MSSSRQEGGNRMKCSDKKGRAGRPTFDDADEILAYMTQRVASGMSITAAARGGLHIGGWQINRYGEHDPIGRHFTADATLERRYRLHLEALNEEFLRMTEAYRREGARLIGFAHAPQPPLSFTHGRALKRGRPQKKSRG
jgi:hypothetical protein